MKGEERRLCMWSQKALGAVELSLAGEGEWDRGGKFKAKIQTAQVKHMP